MAAQASPQASINFPLCFPFRLQKPQLVLRPGSPKGCVSSLHCCPHRDPRALQTPAETSGGSWVEAVSLALSLATSWTWRPPRGTQDLSLPLGKEKLSVMLSL